MTKGEIIESVLKELRSGTTVKRKRTSEEDDEQDVITHLEAVLPEAQSGDDILTCADFVHLSVECCDTCHHYSFPYDMSPMVKLQTGRYAWICCGVKRATGGQIAVVAFLTTKGEHLHRVRAIEFRDVALARAFVEPLKLPAVRLVCAVALGRSDVDQIVPDGLIDG